MTGKTIFSNKKERNYKLHYQLPDAGDRKKQNEKEDKTHIQEPRRKNTHKEKQTETGDNYRINDLNMKKSQIVSEGG